MKEEFSLELLAGADGFGDGDHPTTQLALQAIYALAPVKQAARVLDMGCGSGLLAMTAAHLWPQAEILAVDIAREAVETAQQNIRHNGLESRIALLRSEGYRHPRIQAAAPFDVVVCNITADPILAMAADLRDVLAEGGVAVLSGILRWRSQEVLDMHRHLGLEVLGVPLSMNGWDAHFLQKPTID